MTIDVHLERMINNSYTVNIDPLRSLTFSTKVAIITNPTVSGLHLETLLSHLHAPEIYTVTIPDGEEYKTLETVEFILNSLFEHRLDRKSILIAFGGGVIGDMVGFCAAIFQRGINFIQIPTTLLSMVDSSVGGKTGFNNRFGKNLIGAFHQPQAVYIDPSFLETLPKREFSAGFAEMIKMAIMFDADFFTFLETHPLNTPEALHYAIKRCIELKADVVEKDEKESGVRMVLNYGHTFAHVIETQTHYTRYLHGEAVAIGIVMANNLATTLGLLSKEENKRITALLSSYALPLHYEIPQNDAETFYEGFFLDKKTHNKSLTFILPRGIGGFEIVKDPHKDAVLSAITHSCSNCIVP